VGNGHVYQGRFKSFPIETSEYLLTVCRYVERNPVRAGLVTRAEQWQWSSAASSKGAALHQWPIPRPQAWAEWVNVDEQHEQVEALRRSVVKGQPFGSEPWTKQMVTRWNLGMTLRERGRPPKELRNNGS
jgi:putative transposase